MNITFEQKEIELQIHNVSWALAKLEKDLRNLEKIMASIRAKQCEISSTNV